MQAQPPSELSYQLEVPSAAIAFPRSLKGHRCPSLPQELLPKREKCMSEVCNNLKCFKVLGGKTIVEGKEDNEMLEKMNP